MKKIFVSSRLRGDIAEVLFNKSQAEKYCRYVVDCGHMPMAPHIFFTRFMDDDMEEHRNLALDFCKKLVRESDELWVFTINGFISEGMQIEINEAISNDITIRYFDCFMGVINEKA